ncbi:head decoration protein [Methylocystis hirsuta]|uniref:Head decoration protein n=1 Tax=Methylocystis hirsuta TaxID=369798 RepID=A0A3M9XN01_9HYPH|nr:head decoration protein [Methylocystis hirsuta]RNJ49371.1 head decoration protein [Methylocystis hirsuta]
MSAPYTASFRTVDAFVSNQLFLGGKHPIFMDVILEGGQDLPAGAVLGRVSATDKFKLTASAAGDGSQNAIAILSQPVKTYDVDGVTPKDTPFRVVVEGYVNPSALTFGAGHTWASTKDSLRQAGIYGTLPVYSGG